MKQYTDDVIEMMQGAYDLHVHAAPAFIPRVQTDSELFEDACRFGMAGVLIKEHYMDTTARAEILNARGEKTKAFGSLALSHACGGLNPDAVMSSLMRGASCIWMPTLDAENSIKGFGMRPPVTRRPAIRILDEAGKLKPEVMDILDVVKEFDGLLATGHLSLEESYALCKEGRSRGVRMVLTHPDENVTKIPVDVQKELAEDGVMMEKLWFAIRVNDTTAAAMAESMREIGIEHCFMATDMGGKGRETAVEGMMNFMTELMEAGIAKADIIRMVQDNPRILMKE